MWIYYINLFLRPHDATPLSHDATGAFRYAWINTVYDSITERRHKRVRHIKRASNRMLSTALRWINIKKENLQNPCFHPPKHHIIIYKLSMFMLKHPWFVTNWAEVVGLGLLEAFGTGVVHPWGQGVAMTTKRPWDDGLQEQLYLFYADAPIAIGVNSGEQIWAPLSIFYPCFRHVLGELLHAHQHISILVHFAEELPHIFLSLVWECIKLAIWAFPHLIHAAFSKQSSNKLW